MKKTFLTGLVILLPIALTLLIVSWLLNLLTDPFIGMMEQLICAVEAHVGSYRYHDLLVICLSRLLVVFLLCCLVFLLGICGRRFFVRNLLRWSQQLFNHIPLVKTIYTISRDVAKSLFETEGPSFKQSVLIPFPHVGTHALGLVAGPPPAAIQKRIHDRLPGAPLTVFVPTSPHPISGYILIAGQKELIDLDLSTEEVFRYLIACGLVEST